MLIVLAGTIGAGKSSLAAALGEHLGTDVFYEAVDNNPVLDLYYQDPKKYAFLLQIYFLNKRFKSIKEAYQADNNILDRSIFEDELFLKLNYKNGNVTKTELDIYQELLANMLEELEGMPKKRPDLLIYIDVSFDKMLERIEKRGRSFEQVDGNPSLEQYYHQVHGEYPAWYEDYKVSPKMKIDGNSLDFVQNPQDLATVLKMIDTKLKELHLL
ncbi:TPA: deoxynucleoside kinase [Streptococcus pyogenes]|uniref:deoxynucleoside kinase n=1 Tax=Streptococcus pyogenes TaxID=1314 RepID=UPI0003C7D2D4|nr:deoxynucleoside kinase [Streptococcus pyogenes]HER4512174.1 deoxynucleoside kinase [Streptococcus pyogenes NGAS729]HER4517294.1 deoxynucleoside kinase [Streptococcus pyogenes NGAS732]HER4536481.1 deoxynucleoside kinase [Streptococcus pyogenes NGAS757]HER4587875.1 deoxynucleoside kinase [Streptococcus pyogenes NGAS615]HER4596362.1 deoxynucleoside kinase [Streptococcus pyogenes NGAS613]HER4603220.1 deoxynucleoside kinase [Streptococcus pyogenes NGAS608]HER4606372.1 deoxynucleoside kinase [S